jgi:methylenetetrahydrofolate reductase (NADPH)
MDDALSPAQFLRNPRFEVIPIKGLDAQVDALPDGSTVTVTCSPRFGMERTIERCAQLAERKITIVPHIAARMVAGTDHWESIQGSLAQKNIENLFVIGGDADTPAGPYGSAGDFLSASAESIRGFASVGIGGHPEGHPLISASDLMKALIQKQPFSSYLATQICFEPDTIANWLREIRSEGITLPVYVGIPGVVKVGKLIEISTRIGVGDSLRYFKKNTRMMMRFLSGGYRPDHLVDGVEELAEDSALGIAGFHIFTFNQVQNTETWRRERLGITQT